MHSRFVNPILSSFLLVCFLVMSTSARADWIDPPSRPWKVSAQLAFPYSDFTLVSRKPPDGTPNDNKSVAYSVTPSLVPALVFGYRFLNFGISRKLFNESGPLADKYGPSNFNSFRFGVNRKFWIGDFAIQGYKGMHTGTSTGNRYLADLRYLMTGFNFYGGVSFSGDVPYSMQSYYGQVEVPEGNEFDVTGFASFNWNSLISGSPLIPIEKAEAFGAEAQLRGFKAITLKTGVGLGWTIPFDEHWMFSTMGIVGLSFSGASQIYTADNNYAAEIGTQLGLRAAFLYRHENHTYSLKGLFDRNAQDIRNVKFTGDVKGLSLAYAFRF